MTDPDHTALINTLIVLQTAIVAFQAGHEWIPLGRLNNLPARTHNEPLRKLVLDTTIGTLPFLVGLIASLIYTPLFPPWLVRWLWISYAALFVGQLQSWWVPYLILPDPVRAGRYEELFGHTHAFGPRRNGIRLNTLHVASHAPTLAILILLAILTLK